MGNLSGKDRVSHGTESPVGLPADPQEMPSQDLWKQGTAWSLPPMLCSLPFITEIWVCFQVKTLVDFWHNKDLVVSNLSR